MKPKSLIAVLAVAMGGALLTDGILLCARERLWQEAERLPTARIWVPRADAIPSGLLASGLDYGPGRTNAGCFALLYTSSECKFCAAQLPDWRKLVERTRTLGCDALRVAADRISESPLDTTPTLGRELVFVSPGWASGSPPTLTPTLMIFSRNAHTAWCHVGELDQASAHAALRALELAAAVGPAPIGQFSKKDDRMTCR